jgi:hypothetical protein
MFICVLYQLKPHSAHKITKKNRVALNDIKSMGLYYNLSMIEPLGDSYAQR